MSETYLSQSAASHRFDPEPVRQAALREAKSVALRLRNQARSIEGAAIGFGLGPAGVGLEVALAFDERGARALDAVVRRSSPDEPISRWSESPAIARLLLRLRPSATRAVLESVGIGVPEEQLAGPLAALVLGLDTDCPAAKAAAKASPVFALPIAATVGLARHLELRTLIARGLPGWVHGASLSPEGTLIAEAFGNPLELRATDEVLLIGTGPGGGAAAARRWANLGPPAVAPGPEPAFVELGLDLATASAAINAGSFGDDTRPELLAIERLHRKLRPGLSRYRAIMLRALRDDARTVRLLLEATR